jgi:hypothetical protein
VIRLVRAAEVDQTFDEIRDFAAARPDETIEISWRAVDDA